jgi:hypothetical protein
MPKEGEMANAEPVVAPPVISPLAPLAFREAKTMPECPHEVCGTDTGKRGCLCRHI